MAGRGGGDTCRSRPVTAFDHRPLQSLYSAPAVSLRVAVSRIPALFQPVRLDIVVATYRQDHWLEALLYGLAVQTRKDFRVVVVHDGPSKRAREAVEEIGRRSALRLVYAETPRRFKDWGHSSRAHALEHHVDSPYVLFTNGDNYYVPRFVEFAMAPFENPAVGVVYFDMVHSHDRTESVPPGEYGYFRTEFQPFKCDIGAFITRTDIAKRVGFRHRHNVADAVFIEEINADRIQHPFEIVKVDRVLFVHN
jgi:cellulose synthase/poly-beta-1,6-N-acetylglucosamine synthase-like glycosyltransferase